MQVVTFPGAARQVCACLESLHALARRLLGAAALRAYGGKWTCLQRSSVEFNMHLHVQCMQYCARGL